MIKFPYLVLKNVKKDCIVFMPLLLVKIRNIVGSSANRADGHIVFVFFVFFLFPPNVLRSCSYHRVQCTVCRCHIVCSEQGADVKTSGGGKSSKVYDRRPGAVAAQDEIRKKWGEQSIFLVEFI